MIVFAKAMLVCNNDAWDGTIFFNSTLQWTVNPKLVLVMD